MILPIVISVLTLLVIGGGIFCLYWFLLRKKPLTVEDILSKGTITLYEWHTSSDAPAFDAFNIAVTNFLLTGKDEDEAAGSILDLNQNGYFSSDGGRARFCFPWAWAAQMIYSKGLLAYGEYIDCIGKARQCADAFKNQQGSQKQMGLAPLLDFLAAIEPSYATNGKFINTQDHSVFCPELGSSHYGGLGQFNLLVDSRIRGKLTEENIESLARFIIQTSGLTRYPWSREYFDMDDGGNWWLSTALYLMSVAKGGTKENLKWIIERQIRYLIDHDKPINVFAPLFIEAEWDETDSTKPDFENYLLTCPLQDSRKHRAETAYLTNSFRDCRTVPALCVIREGDISVLVNLCPQWSSKGDDGFPGEILSICDGDRELINGACFYQMESASQHSTIGNAYEVHTGYDGNTLTVSADGWTRKVYPIDNGVRIEDSGTVRSYYHFADIGFDIGVDEMEIGKTKIEFAADHDAAVVMVTENKGFRTKTELALRMDGAGFLEVTKE